MLTEFWSFSSYTAAGLAAVAIPGLVMVPEYFWSRWLQFTSAVNARFLIGVQTRLAPMTAKLKSGLQPAKPLDGAKLATKLVQIRALPVSPYFSWAHRLIATTDYD